MPIRSPAQSRRRPVVRSFTTRTLLAAAGFGLALAPAAIRPAAAHDGDVEATAQAEGGLLVTVRLPLAVAGAVRSQ